MEMTGKNITFFEVDICDKPRLRNVFNKVKIDCVLHIAALKSVGESCTSPLKYYSVNVGGSINLIEIMQEFKVKKIVFSSSSTVFGEPEYLPIDEKHPTGKCINPYGRTKYFFEEMLKDLVNSNEKPEEGVSFDSIHIESGSLLYNFPWRHLSCNAFFFLNAQRGLLLSVSRNEIEMCSTASSSNV